MVHLFVGLLLYITPDWSKLYDSECWIDSATQIFFAYSIGTGALPALGSYNKFYHNCVKDTVITCFVNSGQNLNKTQFDFIKSMERKEI